MRLLIDNSVSPLVAERFSDAGHDVLHVRNLNMAAASDEEITDFAHSEDRIVPADTDFGTILALRAAAKPSFILLRGSIERRPMAQTTVLVSHLPVLEETLAAGAVVVLTRDRTRVRRLPIAPR